MKTFGKELSKSLLHKKLKRENGNGLDIPQGKAKPILLVKTFNGHHRRRGKGEDKDYMEKSP